MLHNYEKGGGGLCLGIKKVEPNSPGENVGSFSGGGGSLFV